jgi:hypothetical protein
MSNPVIDHAGNKFWLTYGQYHRENGPAIELNNGSEYWYKNGLRHRIDGPAIKRYDGTTDYWYEGQHVNCKSTKEFIKLIKLKVFW